MKKIMLLVLCVGILVAAVYYIGGHVSNSIENSKALGDLERAEKAQFNYQNKKGRFTDNMNTLFRTPCSPTPGSGPWKAYPTVQLDIVSVDGDDSLLEMEAFSTEGNKLYRMTIWTLSDIEYSETDIDFDKRGYVIEVSKERKVPGKK